MNIWTYWLDELRSLVDALSTEAGLGWAWPSALRRCCFAYSCSRYPGRCLCGCVRKKKMTNFSRAPAPQGEVRERAQPVHASMTKLCRKHDLRSSRQSLLGALAQMPLSRHVSGTSKRGRWGSLSPGSQSVQTRRTDALSRSTTLTATSCCFQAGMSDASLVVASAISRSARPRRAVARSAARAGRATRQDPRLQASSSTRAFHFAQLATTRDQLLSRVDIRGSRAARLLVRSKQGRTSSRGAAHFSDQRAAPSRVATLARQTVHSQSCVVRAMAKGH